MPVLGPRRAIAWPIAALAALAIAPAAAHAAPAAPACKAEVLSSSLLTLPLPLLVANAPATPCATDAVGGTLDVTQPAIHVTGVAGRTGETPASGPAERRVRSASAEATDLVADLVPVAGRAPLLRVGALEASVRATCAADVPALERSTRVQTVKLLGTAVTLPAEGVVTYTSATLNGLLPGQTLRLTVDGWALGADGRGGVATALRVELLQTALVGQTRLVDLVLGRATASVGDTNCAAVAPTAAVGDGGRNRRVVATATAGTVAVARGTLAVRPHGSSGAFVDVDTTFDASTGRLSADLPRAAFAPGTYDVRATVTDADGRGASATGSVTIAAPTVGTPVVSGRTLSAAASAPRGTTLASCSFTLSREGASAVVAAGAFQGGACVATVDDDVPAGDSTVDVTVVDSGGDRATARATGTVGALPSAPGVRLAEAANRRVVAPTTAGSGGPATRCTITVRASGSTATPTPIAAALVDGDCRAALPRADFPVGRYEVTVTATDAEGRTGSATGTVVVTAPVVDLPSVVDRVVRASVAPPAGTSASACVVVLTGDRRVELAGAIDGGACTATIPSTVADGDYDVSVTVRDGNGDTGTTVLTGVRIRGTGPVAPTPTPTAPPSATPTPTPTSSPTPAPTTTPAPTPTSTPTPTPASTPTSTPTPTPTSTPTTTPAGPSLPTVTPVDTVVNRVAEVRAEAPEGETIVSCTATTVLAGTAVGVPAQYDAASGHCVAKLAAGTFPVGSYDVTFTVTGSGHGVARRTVAISIHAPGLRLPDGDGREVRGVVAPASGAPVASCVVRFTGGATTVELPGTLGDGVCSATAPAELPAGEYEVTMTVVDVNGDATSATSAMTLPAAATDAADPARAPAGQRAPDAGPATVPDAVDLLTGCSSRRLVLVSVTRTRTGVLLAGVANRALVGKTVEIRASGKPGVIATATVDRLGSFAARAKVRGARGTTRFVANVGGEQSLALKLSRRVQVASASVANGAVTLAGRVTAPRPPRGQRMELRRLVSCNAYRQESALRVGARGRFVVRTAAPTASVAIYRVVTWVPRKRGDKPTTRTFSLPIVVRLAR